MSEIDKERFCSNADCKFHNHYVLVGSKYLNYIDQNKDGEQVKLSDPNRTVNVVTISRNWIYKNDYPLGQFCTDCARELLWLPKKQKGCVMIKTPVHAATELDDEDDITYTGEIYDDNGNSICVAEIDLVDEIVKRINLHEKLIILLKESKFALSQQYGVDSMFLDEVNNVLEQCK